VRLTSRCGKGKEQRKEKAMLARFDHHPMLTALLALTTAVLVVVVITLSTLLITSAPAPSYSSFSDGGGNPAAPAGADVGQGFSNQSSTEHKAEVLAAQSGHFTQGSPAEKKAEAVAAKSGHFAP
jgi:hypothetical protein